MCPYGGRTWLIKIDNTNNDVITQVAKVLLYLSQAQPTILISVKVVHPPMKKNVDKYLPSRP